MLSAQSVSKHFFVPDAAQKTMREYFLSGFRRANLRRIEVLNSISFEIKNGEWVGVVGKNGSGKSTLLKILAGIYAPSSGKIQVSGSLVPLLELGVGFHGDLSVRQNIVFGASLLGLGKSDLEHKIAKILAFSDLSEFQNTPLKNLSSGMQARLAFALATQVDAEIFLFDEILAVGDFEFQRKCLRVFEKLKQKQKTVLMVSHGFDSVLPLFDRLIWIENSHVRKIGPAQKIWHEFVQT